MKKILSGTLFLLAVAANSYHPSAQELKVYVVSEAAQRAAIEFGIGQRLGLADFGAEAYRQYLDVITTTDIIATARAAYEDRKVENADFEAALIAACLWPYGPSKIEVAQWVEVRSEALQGAYLSEGKRMAIREAIGGHLLKWDVESLTALFAKSMTSDFYQEQVFDYSLLMK